MSKGPEAKLKAECRAWLREQGAYVFSPVQMGYGDTTLDDLICLRGHFIAVEYKRPDTKPEATPRQQLKIQEIRKAGGMAFVIYDFVDLRALVAHVL